MDIKDYAQMMSYLTRPRDVVPDPRPMAQGGRIGFSKGADTSPVYNEKTGHIYKIGNRHGQFYSKTPPKNQFTARPDSDGKMKDVEPGVPDEVVNEGSVFEDNMTEFGMTKKASGGIARMIGE